MSFGTEITTYKTDVDFSKSFENLAFPTALWDESPFKTFDTDVCDTNLLTPLTFQLAGSETIFTIPVD